MKRASKYFKKSSQVVFSYNNWLVEEVKGAHFKYLITNPKFNIIQYTKADLASIKLAIEEYRLNDLLA